MCTCVHVWALLVVPPKMRYTCVWAAGIAEQHDGQRVQVYSYPLDCKSIHSNTRRKQTFRNFLTASTQQRHSRITTVLIQMHLAQIGAFMRLSIEAFFFLDLL